MKNDFKYEMNSTFFKMDFEEGFEGSLALFVVIGGVTVRRQVTDVGDVAEPFHESDLVHRNFVKVRAPA
jgi:hypothetical protein